MTTGIAQDVAPGSQPEPGDHSPIHELSATERMRSGGRRRVVAGVVLAVVFAVAYWLVASAYNAEGLSTVNGAFEDEVRGLAVRVEPVSVDAKLSQASIHLTFMDSDGSLTDDDSRLSENVRVLIESGTDTAEMRFPAGSVLGQDDVTVWLDGELATYPFDSYDGALSVLADTYERSADGSFTSTGQLFTAMTAHGGVNGWDTTVDITTTPASAQAVIGFSRAFSSQIFAIMLLVLAVLLALSALFVGLFVNSGRRRMETAIMSWTAALLFALPLLRNFMPNAPPIGASIDIYVYLWVMVGTIIGALLAVSAWFKHAKSRASGTGTGTSGTGSHGAA